MNKGAFHEDAKSSFVFVVKSFVQKFIYRKSRN